MPEPVTLVAIGSGCLGLAVHLARRYFELAKEVFDILAGFIALILALPVLCLCGIWIKLASRGPLIYTQVRVGKDGKLFTMYKLRTMSVDTELASRATWTQANDPRVVRGCQWMRFSHVDELPQLINVINGEMSLIGPRPERPEILAELEKYYPQARKRLAVRPGITGLSQIRCGYDTTVEAFRYKLEGDLEYIDQRRWTMEFRILAGTVSKFHDKNAR